MKGVKEVMGKAASLFRLVLPLMEKSEVSDEIKMEFREGVDVISNAIQSLKEQGKPVMVVKCSFDTPEELHSMDKALQNLGVKKEYFVIYVFEEGLERVGIEVHGTEEKDAIKFEEHERKCQEKLNQQVT